MPSAMQWDISNNLKSNTIYDIYQDKKGKIYIGHEKGMSIYNGVKVANPKGIAAANSISNFVELSPNLMICRSFQGNYYGLKKDTLSEINSGFSINAGYPSFFKTDIGIFGVQHNTVFKVTNAGQYLPLNNLINPFERINASFISGHHLYMSTTEGLKKYLSIVDLSSQKEVYHKSVKPEETQMVFGHQQRVGVLTRQTQMIEIFEDGQRIGQTSIAHKIPANVKITHINEKKNGNVLFGTFSGFYVFDKNFNLKSHELQDFQVSCFMEDMEGNLWVGTLRDGIFIIPNLQNRTLFLASKLNNNIKVANSVVTHKHLVLGTFDGKLIFLKPDGQLDKTINLGKTAEIQAMHFNPAKNELMVYSDNFYILDATTGKIKQSEFQLSTKCIDVFENTIATGTSGGLYITQGNTKNKFLDSFWIQELYFMNKDELLLQTGIGLLHFYIDENRFTKLQCEGLPKNLTELNDRYFFRMNSLVYEYKEGKTTLFYTHKSGGIEKLMSDGEHLWLIDEAQGIYNLSGNNKEIFTKTNAIFQDEVLAFYHLAGNYLSVGIDDVQVIKYPKSSNSIAPYLTISALEGTYQLEGKQYVSGFSKNELGIAYAFTPNISARGNAVLYYKLVGYHSQWQTLNSKDDYKLNLTRIPFGKYTLEAYAKNESGVKSNVVSLLLVIKPPYYLQWWFLLLVAFLVICVFVALLYYNKKALKKKNEEQREKENLKLGAIQAELRAIRAQMNPHFIFNSLSSIQKNILNDENIHAYRNLSTFAKLLRQAIEYTKEEYLTLDKELDFLNNYIALEQLRCDYAFNYELIVEPNLDPKQIVIPSLISQPFVENAILHGLLPSEKEKNLTITISAPSPQAVLLQIADNGVGLKHAQNNKRIKENQHTSFALNAVKERIALINKNHFLHANLQMDSTENGTTILLTFTQTNDK